MNTTDEHILALSWNIATTPKLYRALAPNPYTPKSFQIIAEKFPHEIASTVIRAFVLAEPEGRYDWYFSQLGIEEQTKERKKQKNNSLKIHTRLTQHIERYRDEFREIPKEIIYDMLSLVAFGTDDANTIEQTHSQRQRREYRLSIIHFIEAMQRNNDGPPTTTYDSNKKLFFKRPVFSIGVAVLLFLFLFSLAQINTLYSTKYPETTHEILGIATKIGTPVVMPKRLTIPAINVDAAIQQVGVSQSGEMDVPTNTIDVGWFNLGSRPGEKGSAVIAGHFDGKNGEVGVFAHLNALQKGDAIYITHDNGTTLKFIVRETHAYDPGYADDVFGRNDGMHLNLITCDGVWNGVEKGFSKRLVVFADIAQ